MFMRRLSLISLKHQNYTVRRLNLGRFESLIWRMEKECLCACVWHLPHVFAQAEIACQYGIIKVHSFLHSYSQSNIISNLFSSLNSSSLTIIPSQFIYALNFCTDIDIDTEKYIVQSTSRQLFKQYFSRLTNTLITNKCDVKLSCVFVCWPLHLFYLL